ncbi:CHAP domain-containing protein [Atopomonas sediminilitoris]|uniref:CHAP domain-containing protein n=1 Tax=Atopomonas sediminilitoris TaxID=2919919 RepID=UPI001F4D7611|nr:CHAP domain-containing protein [Atopomonas sediminilitoris]MCJ8168506.1 CHAP domain-containing protein [Atopomonas sediminilitoris]
MTKRRLALLIAGLLPVLALASYAAITRINLNPRHTVGEQLDALNGVAIYYNGGVNTVQGRHLSKDGYNLGLRYQCVEFVKRYYFERHNHRMPDTYGHAKDFFDPRLNEGELNTQRAMLQFHNGGSTAPQADDLLVFGPSLLNRYGHVAVIASVGATSLEIAQQNPGPFGNARENLALTQQAGRWTIQAPEVLGWLRLPPAETTAEPGNL